MSIQTPGLLVSNVTKRFGSTLAVNDVSFGVAQNQIVALLGPSGCGKTTTLRLIAGFEHADHGSISIGGENARGKRPYERDVGLLFQDYALFPHMTVEDNIAYGLRRRGLPRDQIPVRIEEMLQLVKLPGLGSRRPSQLSGGQQQRVALARSLAIAPAVVLLDEPLSALDAKLRHELRVELKEILRSVSCATLVVTHDQEEAMSLADRIIVMDRGRVMQEGTPEEIYATPANRFVAEFVGRSNWFRGHFLPSESSTLASFQCADGLSIILRASSNIIENDQCDIAVRPEKVRILSSLQRLEPESSLNENRLEGSVEEIQYLGADTHIWVRLKSGKRLHAINRDVNTVSIRHGSAVVAVFLALDCMVFPST